MPKDRIRCQNCKAALRKEPDIPERVEWWTWETVWYEGYDMRYPGKQPVPATDEQVNAGEAWKVIDGPIWTCGRCKHENDADYVGEQLAYLADDGEWEPEF